MDSCDSDLLSNRDWDPVYLRELFTEDFYEFKDLWKSNVNDMELVEHSQKVECYVPIVEDISVEDDVLCSAMDEVEKE